MPLIPVGFGVESIRRWRNQNGRARFPGVARHLEVGQIGHRTSATTTRNGLSIRAAYDLNWYPKASESPTPNLPPPYPSIDKAGTAIGITPPHPEA